MKSSAFFLACAIYFATPALVFGQSFFVSYAPVLIGFSTLGKKEREHQLGHQIEAGWAWTRGQQFSYWTGLGYQYHQAQYGFDITFTRERLTTWYRHQDLTIPVYVRYGFRSTPNRFYATAGVIPGFRLSRKVLEERSSLPGFSRDATSEQGYDPFELSVGAGLGYSFMVKNQGKGFIQTSIRSSFPTQVYYLFRYLFGRRNDTNDDPPVWNSFGLTFGYVLS